MSRLVRVEMMMMILLLIQDYVKSALTRKLSVFSCPVVMPRPVKNVPQGLRTLVNLVPTVGNQCQQPIGFTCETDFNGFIICK